MKEYHAQIPVFCVLKERHKDDAPGFDYRPTRGHKTKEAALGEAVRLSRKHRGHTFQVLQFRHRVTCDEIHLQTFPTEA